MPVPIICLESTLHQYAESFRGVFTKPQFQHFVTVPSAGSGLGCWVLFSLPNGNILTFDNGAYRKDQVIPWSRVIEVDPAANEIVWESREEPDSSFFSAYISGARRLPNGNTLITEGNSGRMFQVTPDKKVVWEYINPYSPEGPDGTPRNDVFRITYYLPEDAPAFR